MANLNVNYSLKLLAVLKPSYAGCPKILLTVINEFLTAYNGGGPPTSLDFWVWFKGFNEILIIKGFND